MLGLAWLVAFSLNTMLFSVPPLFGVIREDLGVSFTELSLLISLVAILTVFLAIPGGFLADTLGVRKTVGIAIGLVGAGGFLRVISADFSTLLAFSAMSAIGYALTLPNLPKLVSQWFPRRLAGTASGIYISGFPIGATAALALSFIFFSIIGSWQTVLAMWGAIGLVATAGWWLLTKAPPEANSARRISSGRSSLRQVLKRRSVWTVALIAFLSHFIFFVETGWLPSFYVDRGVEESLAGVLVSTLTIGNMAGVFLAPAASDKLGLRRPFLWGFSLVTVVGGYLLLPSPTELGWILMPVLGFAVAVSFVFIFLLPVELVDASEVGSASGIMLSVGNVGAILGPLLVGYLRDVTGDFQLIPLLLAIAAAAMVASTFALPETGYKQQKKRTT